MERIAQRKQCTVGQLSLAWLHAQGDDVIPIPGTTNIHHLHENLDARNIKLSSEDLNEIHEILSTHEVKGDRYPHMSLTFRGNE